MLKISDKPAVRAVLWEGVPILSDSDAKPPARNNRGGSGKGGSGNGRRNRKPLPLGDVGRLLSNTYGDTLKEEIPPDLLALLGKLD